MYDLTVSLDQLLKAASLRPGSNSDVGSGWSHFKDGPVRDLLLRPMVVGMILSD